MRSCLLRQVCHPKDGGPFSRVGDSIEPSFAKIVKDAKGIVVFGHGLNVKPEAMLELADLFPDHSHFVLRLSGHEAGVHQECTAEQWLKLWLRDVEEQLGSLFAYAAKRKLQVHFVAHSLSCALWLAVAAKRRDFCFERVIFLAPAITKSFLTASVEVLELLGFNYLPSLNREEHRVRNHTSIAMYRAVVLAIDKVYKIDFASWKPKILILMAPKDRLVPFRRLESFIAANSLPWALVPLLPQALRGITRYHLLFDRRELGPLTWKFMRQAIASYLATDTAFQRHPCFANL